MPPTDSESNRQQALLASCLLRVEGDVSSTQGEHVAQILAHPNVQGYLPKLMLRFTVIPYMGERFIRSLSTAVAALGTLGLTTGHTAVT